ncbi:NO-inducible flavohemoprotein [Aquibacillus rhizosphaerae]|uniref:Flavohemoprotein n=1 Tax=Aquibacillus rhizosphaerae TaxID=3051431 RepID=A0ABT7L030_9BACI|nr:NO-inducible flavohemoprotein [Aquibacillus sp. LR5S19]MDL4839131.1 NO-inducible flavohemoprotein [Aquibacillus sp. LR5S19]
MLDKTTIDTIKATVPVLEVHGQEITKRFYQLLFENYPELKNIFNQTNQKMGKQSQALANAVYAAAVNIDKLEEILPTVKQIAHKHVSLNIQPEHYPIVGENLLLAIKEVLGDAATPEILEAWEKAYGVIADVFIEIEADMYKETEIQTGGWSDFRDFKVIKKEQESDVITSFYLKPVDGGNLPIYNPGQYITVKIENPDAPYHYLRQYSLSCKPNGSYFRISVKREDGINGNPDGDVSTFLHTRIQEGDILPVSAPAGEFILKAEEKPLVLISGGVGITPFISMLETVVAEQPERSVYFIHAAQNGAVHSFKETIQSLSEENAKINSYVIYSNPTAEDLKTKNYHKVGLIDLDWLQSVLPSNEAAFYFCGPDGFMKTVYQELKRWNVMPQDINFEFFGPSKSLD